MTMIFFSFFSERGWRVNQWLLRLFILPWINRTPTAEHSRFNKMVSVEETFGIIFGAFFVFVLLLQALLGCRLLFYARRMYMEINQLIERLEQRVADLEQRAAGQSLVSHLRSLLTNCNSRWKRASFTSEMWYCSLRQSWKFHAWNHLLRISKNSNHG
jgi:hypothetical protein